MFNARLTIKGGIMNEVYTDGAWKLNCPVCGKTLVNFRDEDGEFFNGPCPHVALVNTQYSDYIVYDDSLKGIVENMLKFLNENDAATEDDENPYKEKSLIDLLTEFASDSVGKFEIYAIDDPDPVPPMYETYDFLIKMVDVKTELDDFLVDEYKKQAQIFVKRRQYQFAIDALTTSRGIRNDEEVNTLLIDTYTEAIRLKPNNADSYSGRGYSYFRMCEYQRAIEDYSEAIRLNPAYAYAYYGRACVNEKLKNFKRAIEDYSEAIRLYPDGDAYYYGRGDSYFNIGQYDRAIEDYSEAIRVNPDGDDAYPYLRRGDAYFEIGKYDCAIADYNKAIRIDPDDSYSYVSRGLSYFKIGKYDRAIADCNKAIRIDPDDAYAHYNKARCLAIQKKVKQACSSLKLAIKKGYEDWDEIKKNKDFDNIRNESSFIDLLKDKEK